MKLLSYICACVVWSGSAIALPLGSASALTDTRAPLEGFVEVNHVQLEYLDWGGAGPSLILIHGLADTAHVFDDIAPAFTDAFHVIAYTRRGSIGSEIKGPYDLATLTEDLRGLMDALGIAKADLIGLSAGGDEVTQMAATYPDRVRHVVYLDAAYDWASPMFQAAVQALPIGFFDPPASALASLNAYRAYQQATIYPSLDAMQRVEANLRQKVVVQTDRSVRVRMSKDTVAALYAAVFTNQRRDYSEIHCPTLAVYAEHLYDWNIADVKHRRELINYEKQYWTPFQASSTEHLRRSLASAQIHHVNAAHSSLILTHRQQVVAMMRKFLLAPH